MIYTQKSEPVIIDETKTTKQQINLIQQFFIHTNPARQEEIKFCLRMNVLNPLIDYIYLLNERWYTKEELGIDHEKIIQIQFCERLSYDKVFKFVSDMNCGGYVILANADIFLDFSLENLYSTNLDEKPLVMCQLRYEFNGDIKSVKVFGPRPDSQDCWIFHSKWISLLSKNLKAFKFQLGMPGCDNHITYLFKICGFGLVNDPQLVHALHYHTTEIRDYTRKDQIKSPYILIYPVGCFKNETMDAMFEDYDILGKYIEERLSNNKNFVIPRIAGIENKTAHDPDNARLDVMKNNAGILITNPCSNYKYAEQYFEAFNNCDMYSGWCRNNSDNVYRGISNSHDYVEDVVCKDKQKIWAHALDIFEQINLKPWTISLKGKRILLVSSFIESFKRKISIREKIYGIDLFPECTFEFIKPPQTNGKNTSLEWDKELLKFTNELDKMRDLYDVALVSAGGYGNLICNHIYKTGRSAIYVGGTLQMYFGIYGNRWLQERPAIIRMYLNEHWSRPTEEEKPKGYKAIENNCYW